MNNRFTQADFQRPETEAEQSNAGVVELATGGFQEKVSQWLSQLKRTIIENPALALAMAAATGLALGMLLKRR